jgi:hypothetical protein
LHNFSDRLVLENAFADRVHAHLGETAPDVPGLEVGSLEASWVSLVSFCPRMPVALPDGKQDGDVPKCTQLTTVSDSDPWKSSQFIIVGRDFVMFFLLE